MKLICTSIESIPAKKGEAWRNKKTGKPYHLISAAIDATNERDGLWVVIYKNEAGDLFVRESGEFFEKFVRADCPTPAETPATSAVTQ